VLRLESGHPASFLINGNEQRPRAQVLQLPGQGPDLFRAADIPGIISLLDIAVKEDHSAAQTLRYGLMQWIIDSKMQSAEAAHDHLPGHGLQAGQVFFAAQTRI